MRRIAVLGAAGAMGRIIVGDLRRFGADPIEADLPRFDVTRRSTWSRLRGADVVIASLPYRLNLAAMEVALAIRAHYVDLGGLFHMTRRQLRLDARFRRAGVAAILGMGSSPGITNVLAAAAAEGDVREVHCMVGARDTSPSLFGYSPETLLDEFSLPSAVFRAGRLRFVPPLDPSERRFERFPPPVGRIVIDTTLHSELATLPRFFRGVREVTFRQGFDSDVAARLALLVRLGFARADRRAALAALPRPAPGVRHEVLRVRVVGRRTVVADCVVGPRAGSGVGPDIDTGAPPSIVAQWLASGALAPRPGVVAPEEAIPPRAFFAELARRGMEVRIRRGRDSNPGDR